MRVGESQIHDKVTMVKDGSLRWMHRDAPTRASPGIHALRVFSVILFLLLSYETTFIPLNQLMNDQQKEEKSTARW